MYMQIVRAIPDKRIETAKMSKITFLSPSGLYYNFIVHVHANCKGYPRQKNRNCQNAWN